MLYAVKHSLGVSLVHAKSPKSAEKFIREYFGTRVKPITVTNNPKDIEHAKACGAREFEVEK